MVFWRKHKEKNLLLSDPGASSYRTGICYVHYNMQIIYLSLQVKNANVAEWLYIAFS